MSCTIRVANCGAGFAYPRILGEPFVLVAAQRAECAAEEYGSGVEGCAVNLHAGGNGPLCLGATYHHCTH
jgi:hypothetical protein